MRKKVIPVLAAAMLVVILVLIMLATKMIEKYTPSKEMADLNAYYGLTQENELAIILNQEILETKGIVEGDHVYVEYDTLHDFINERFYWDKNENKLLYTTSTDLIRVEAGESDYYISNKKQAGECGTIVKVREDKVYINLAFVEKYSNMDFEVFKAPNRVLIRTEFGEITMADVKRDSEVRYRGGIKSDILSLVKEDDSLILMEEGDEWSQVMTKDGYIGYIRKKDLGKSYNETAEYEMKVEEFTHLLKDETINMAWHQVTSSYANTTLTEVLSSTKGVNVISPTWFYLNDNEGNIANFASYDYVEYCHNHGIEVWGLVSNLENPAVDSTKVLTTTSIREKLINKLIAAAIEYNLDGINVDFESLSIDVGDGFIQFIRELSLKCHNNGLVLSVDNYVPSDYTAFYDRKEQAVFADYVIIMAYDEHYAGSDAGSVSSMNYVKTAVENTLKEVPAEQIILGLPFYTRVWKETPVTNDEGEITEFETTSQATGMDTTANMVRVNGAEPAWDETTCQYYAEYENGGSTYKVWMEEERSVEEKLKVMKENSLAGVSFWKLGFERASIWDTIIRYME